MLHLLRGTGVNHQVLLLLSVDTFPRKLDTGTTTAKIAFSAHNSYVYMSAFILTETQSELERPRSMQPKCSY